MKSIFEFLKSTTDGRGQIRAVFSNKWVLYVLLLLAISQLLQLAWMQEWMLLMVFVLLGALLTYFTKNMSIILAVTLVTTQLLRCGTHLCLSEGFEDTTGKLKVVADPVNPETTDTTKVPDEENDPEAAVKPSIATTTTQLDDLQSMKKEAVELLDIQSKLIDGMTSMDPLVKRAQEVVTKYESFMSKVQNV
jgi:hypothetical protein